MRFRHLIACVFAATIAVIVSAGPLAAQSDVIRGRITGSDSLPVENARITVTSVVSMIERSVRTDKNGRFTVIFPGSDGHYVVAASMIGYVVKQFELKRTGDQDVLVADAQLEKVQLEPVVVAADVRGTIPRNSTAADATGTTQGINAGLLPPDQQGNLAAMAASLPGVLLIPGINGGADGFSVLGLDPVDNTVTLNGMTFEGGSLPRDAGVSSSLTTSPYDVSRGGFSGGELALRSVSGSNIIQRGISFNPTLPQLTWRDYRSQSTQGENTLLSVGGKSSGPIKLNSSFYNVSFEHNRSSSPFKSLVNTNAVGLYSQNIAADSVARLLGVLGSLNIPVSSGASLNNIVSDRGSFLGSFNFNPPTSARGSQYGLTANANWTFNEPTGGAGNFVTSVPSASSRNASYGGGISLRHTAYFKIFLSESNFGISGSRSEGDPFLTLPSGSVRVSSTFDDGTGGVKDLRFGGASGSSTSNTTQATARNALSWFSTNNKHRLLLTTSLSYSGRNSESFGNYFGTFRFNSLADLESGTPASFARQLNTRRDESGQITGFVSLGDSYRVNPDLQLTYGIRFDGGAHYIKPENNPLVESTFGVRNDFVPNRIVISPRIGFQKTLGTAAQIAAFEGAARGPRAILRGGIGIQANALPSISSVVNNTGLPNSIRSLNCVGPAAPIPDWDLYLADPSAIPDECADGTGGTVFSNSSPSVSLYARNFRSPQSLRSDLSWSGPILDNRFNMNIRGTHSLNMYRGSRVDLNFDPTPVFNLDNEGGRPVFVQTTSIVANTGSIASRDARISQSFSQVNEERSDLKSQSLQLQVDIRPVLPPLANFSWNLGYTFQDVKEESRGFGGGMTAGNPLDIYTSRGGNTARHQFRYNLSYNIPRIVRISWQGALNSGRPYTPRISGDVNGDGSSNDLPFIFDPDNTSDPALAAAMQELLNTTSKDARKCLRAQLGRLASRNSCEGGWNMTGNLGFSIDAATLRLPSRAQLQLSFSNPVGGLDMLINGSRNPKGWGQSNSDQIDQTLFYVRGFDPNTNQFKYEVNERFGSLRRDQRVLNVSTGVQVGFRIDLGPQSERQTLMRNLDYGRSQPGTKYPATLLKSMGSGAIPNPITAVMRQQDSLRLTTMQADSMATLNRRFSIQLDSIWTVASNILYELPTEYRTGDAWYRYLVARRAAVDLLMEVGPTIKGLLTPSQLRKLPPSLHNTLDPRYLSAIRNGTGTFVNQASALLGGGLGSSVLIDGALMSPAMIVR